jgi:hypothetical protein
MKTRKHFIAMALFAVIAILALSMTGCEPEDDKPDPTDNLSVPYGTLPNGVGIYKGNASITDAQMATAVQAVLQGYTALDNSLKPGVASSGLTKIIIISDKNYSWDGSVLGLKFDRPAESITGRFEALAQGELSLTTN